MGIQRRIKWCNMSRKSILIDQQLHETLSAIKDVSITKDWNGFIAANLSELMVSNLNHHIEIVGEMLRMHGYTIEYGYNETEAIDFSTPGVAKMDRVRVARLLLDKAIAREKAREIEHQKMIGKYLIAGERVG